MTLSISDVEKWNPGQLTTAAAAVDQLSKDLDQKVGDSNTTVHNLSWRGTAKNAADTRIDLEKTRASGVSQALQGLKTALSQQVGNLQTAKDKVMSLRNQALDMPAPMGPYEVADNGIITAQGRIKWIQANFHDGDPRRLTLTTLELAEAARRSLELTQALQQAERVANDAINGVDRAKTTIDAAYDTLGDPNSGAGARDPLPAPVSPASVTSPTDGGTPSSGGPGDQNGSPDYQNGTGGGGGYGMPSSGGPPMSRPSGDVQKWIDQAKQILLQMGYRPDQIDENAIATIIMHESGGDPNAINLWDSNAAAGHPSKGLMQCIDSTFNGYAAPGHGDIWNPVDNIVAASRYAIANYGSLGSVPGVELSNATGGQQYQGY